MVGVIYPRLVGVRAASSAIVRLRGDAAGCLLVRRLILAVAHICNCISMSIYSFRTNGL